MRGSCAFGLMLAASTAAGGWVSLGAAADTLSVVEPASGEQILSWRDVAASRGAQIVAEQPAPAPAGLVAFCERMTWVCGGGRDDVVARETPASAAGLQSAAWTGAAPPFEWSGVSREDGAALFSRLLAARAQGQIFEYDHPKMSLTELRWRELGAVNRSVNSQIIATTDASQYGVPEYWAMPITERTNRSRVARGDCEDFALEKRARLIALGWDKDALSLAVAYSRETGLHAVLVVQTDHGDFVLDNLYQEPRSPQSLSYMWVSRQAGAAMTVWASARLEISPSTPDHTRSIARLSRPNGPCGDMDGSRPDSGGAATISGSVADSTGADPSSAPLHQLAQLEWGPGQPSGGISAALAGMSTSVGPF